MWSTNDDAQHRAISRHERRSNAPDQQDAMDNLVREIIRAPCIDLYGISAPLVFAVCPASSSRASAQCAHPPLRGRCPRCGADAVDDAVDHTPIEGPFATPGVCVDASGMSSCNCKKANKWQPVQEFLSKRFENVRDHFAQRGDNYEVLRSIPILQESNRDGRGAQYIAALMAYRLH